MVITKDNVSEATQTAVAAAWGPVAPPEAPSADDKLWGMLANLLGILWLIGPALAWLLKRDSKFVRFNALQMLLIHAVGLVIGILLGVCLTVLAFVPMLGMLVASVISPLFGLLALALIIFLAIKAHNGIAYRLPVLGPVSFARSYEA
jgi:uncharacterized membrane protein